MIILVLFFFPPLPELWMNLLSQRVICLLFYIYQTAWWRIDNPFQMIFFLMIHLQIKKANDVGQPCEFQCWYLCLGWSKDFLPLTAFWAYWLMFSPSVPNWGMTNVISRFLCKNMRCSKKSCIREDGRALSSIPVCLQVTSGCSHVL